MRKTLFLTLLALLPFCVSAQSRATNFDEAREAVIAGRYADAIPFLRESLQKNKKDWLSAYYLSCAMYGTKDYDEQFRLGDIVLRYSENTAGVAFVWLQRGHVYRYEDQDFDEAVKAYTKAIKIQPEEGETYYWRGKAYERLAAKEITKKNAFDSVGMRIKKSKVGEKWLRLAEEDYQEILNIGSPLIYGYSGLESVSYMRGDMEQTEKWALKAQSAEGTVVQKIYNDLMTIYLAQERFSDAASVLEHIIDNNTKFNYTYFWNKTIGEKSFPTLLARYQIQFNKQTEEGKWAYWIAQLYESVKNDHDKAVEYGKKAYAIEPQSAEYASATSGWMVEQGNFKGAIMYADRAIHLDEDKAYPYYNKARSEYYLGHAETAIDLMTEAIAKSPESSFYYQKRGFYYDNLKKIDKAIEDYSVAIELNPNYAYAYMLRGSMYLLEHNQYRAEADFRKAIAIDTVLGENTAAMYSYQALGKNDSAIFLLQRIIEKRTDKHSAYYEAACLYARMGRNQEALEYLEKCFVYGSRDYEHMKLDDDLDGIRDTEEYKRILEKFKPKEYPVEVLPPMPSTPKSNESKLRSLAPDK